MFHEIHGGYYRAAAEIISQAVDGRLTRESMLEAVRRHAFEESVLAIPQALESGRWPLVTGEMKTPLSHHPSMPLTNLQRRWMKTLLQDPRIRLFGVTDEGLGGVEPLYPADAIVWYDRYGDGDLYGDEGYIGRFRLILAALREKRKIRIRFEGRKGFPHTWVCILHRLEYSAKDDKFRVLCTAYGKTMTINLSRMTHCELLEAYDESRVSAPEIKRDTVVLHLTDERNALERVMLHFSHLQKETRRLKDGRYEVRLTYEQEDETEILIRILSFGPVLEAVSPPEFRDKVKERIEKQMKLRSL